MKAYITGQQDPRACEMCGKVAELRPYGPNRERICFSCGMRDEATTSARFAEALREGSVDVEDLGAVIRGSAKRH